MEMQVRKRLWCGGERVQIPKVGNGSPSPPAGNDSNCNLEPQLSLSHSDPHDSRQLLLCTCAQANTAERTVDL